MDSFEAHLDGIDIEAQRPMGDQQKRRRFPMNLINRGACTLTSSRGFLQCRGDGTPPTGDTKYVPEFLTNLRLSDLYSLPGEYVGMHPEIFSAMRAGNTSFLEKMKSYETPMACFKSDEGDSILHLAAAWGHLELVKSIVIECPSLLLESNWKDQLPLHVAARAGHSTVVEAIVDLVKCFSDRLFEDDMERLNLYVVKDKGGNTPLHLAMKDLLEKTECLMHKKRIGLQINKSRCQLETTTACLVKANQQTSFLANKDGISPLYMAVEAGNVSLVKSMLNLPSDNVQGKTSNLASHLEGRKSLVHAALKAKNKDVLDVILNEDPSLVSERDEEGRTCLSVGASVGFYEGICKLLDGSMSSVFECDDDGYFPIHKAVENGHLDIVEELLKRCPDSEFLHNRQGRNILHIAANSGRGGLLLQDFVRGIDRKNHLIEEQDVDGNTPLHIAAICWRPWNCFHASTNTKILNIQNKKGLKALDIAEKNLHSHYVLRERLTLMVLLWAYAPRGVGLIPTTGITLRSRSEHLSGDKYKEYISALLLVAALVATVTFAAGFTMPGGFNSSAPNLGRAILANDTSLSVFLLCDTVAMFTSIVAILALIWAQLGDPGLAHKAFNLALPSLFLALASMSAAFFAGVMATILQNIWLKVVISILFCIFFSFFLLLLVPYVIPQVPGVPYLQRWTSVSLLLLLVVSSTVTRL